MSKHVKIRSLLFVIFILVEYSSFAQYEGYASEFYFGRQPSSRCEAMGHSFTSIEGDASSMHFNPSGIGNLDGVEFSTTYSYPFYTLENANSLAINFASRISNKMAVGYNYNRLNYGINTYFTDQFGALLDSSENIITNNKITVAYRAEPTFFIGGSLGYTSFTYFNYTGQSIQLDFGVNKKFEFTRFKNNQSINLATTFKNPIGKEMELESSSFTSKVTLPLIMQSGVSYYYSSENDFKKLKAFKLITSADFQTLLNSRSFYNKYSAGVELSFLEILHLRGGYYLQTIKDFGNSKNKSKLQDVTYGLGLTVPINKLTDTPIRVSLDYCSLPQPSTVNNVTWDNFNSLTGSLRYILF